MNKGGKRMDSVDLTEGCVVTGWGGDSISSTVSQGWSQLTQWNLLRDVSDPADIPI